MADGDRPPRKRAPVKAWEQAVLGLDSDAWLRSYRRSLKPYETAGDALAFYTRIFDHAPVAMMILGADFLIADANIEAQKLLKKTLETLRGKPFNRHIAKEDRAAFAEISHEILRDHGRVTRPLLMTPGEDLTIEVSVTACALRDDEGNTEFIMLLLMDRSDDVTFDIL
jgi:PAS domain S-box-containing protein